MEAHKVYPGLYRGTVIENYDSPYYRLPLDAQFCTTLCIRVSIPEVYGTQINDQLPWAWPCIPFLGIDTTTKGNIGGVFGVPRLGSTVWIAFEHGDCQHPIYLGGWVGQKTEVPKEAKFVQTAQHSDPLRDITEGSAPGTCDVGMAGTNGRFAYPDIYCIRMPWNADDDSNIGVFFRMVRHKFVEWVWGYKKIFMGMFQSSGSQNQSCISIEDCSPYGGLVRIRVPNGTLILDAKNVQITGRVITMEAAQRAYADPNEPEPGITLRGPKIKIGADNSSSGDKATPTTEMKLDEQKTELNTPSASGFQNH